MTTSLLLGVLIGMVILLIRARLEIRSLRLKAGLGKDVAQFSTPIGQAVKSLQQLSQITYQDKDGDGTPDVFQRRKPLSEMLGFEKPSGNHSNDYWVAIELPARPPDKGEYFISPQGINKADFDYANYNAVIIKAVPGTNLDDLVDLTK